MILNVLYEKRSMTQAAEALYMTQPALTKRIKSIESEWGIEVVKEAAEESHLQKRENIW